MGGGESGSGGSVQKEGKQVKSFIEWLEYAEPIAYKIGIHPAEFDDMQPGEFYRMLEAFRERRKDEDFRRSYFTAMIMSPHLKKPMDPQDLFNPLYYPQDEIRAMKEKQAMDDVEYFKSFKTMTERR